MLRRQIIALSLALLAQAGSFAPVAFAAPAKAGIVPAWSAKIKVPHRAWIPVNKPREILLCVHGLGFSSESFEEFGKTMAANGFAVYAVDVRGFGAWLKKREGNVVDFEGCLNDIEAALKNLRKAYPGTPIFLVGESMGGAIALRATSRYPQLVDALISSVPSSERYANWGTQLKVGYKYIENKDKPVDLSTTVVERSTANKSLQKKLENDKSNRMEISPKELKQFNEFMKGNYDAAALIEKTPVLMLAGFKDKLVKPEGTIDLFNGLTTQDKLLMVVGDGEHLLLEENQLTDQLTGMLTVWIRNQSRSPNPGVTAHP
ncbi:MAG: alpha/beta fold hydrolase [Leptolyngbya sp.]|nr:alpha/beta fold hydrolase [Candidatus Melainabacteria bacterium]